MPTVSYSIANTADDVYSLGLFGSGTGGVAAGNFSGISIWAAWRFLGVLAGVGSGITITAATLTLTHNPSGGIGLGAGSGSNLGRIYGVAQADAEPLEPSSIPFGVPPKGTAFTALTFVGTTTTIDVLAQVLEWRARSGWAEGSDFALLADPTTGSAEHAREFYDYSASTTLCARLDITYETGGPPPPTRRAPRHSYWL